MLVRGENRAIMAVIRAESTELNYDTGGDDGGIIVMLRFSPPVISSIWFVPSYAVRPDLVIRDAGRIGGDWEGNWPRHSVIQVAIWRLMLVRGENRAIMAVIRAESTELNYDMGGDDGGIIVMLRFSPPVISSSWFVPAYTVRADLVIRDLGRFGGDWGGNWPRHSVIQVAIWRPMLVRGENRAIMAVIRAESTKLNYDTGGDDGCIIVMLRFSPPVINSRWFVPAYTVRADLVIRDPERIGGDWGGNWSHHSVIQVAIWRPMLVHGENRAIMAVIRAESMELNYNPGGDDGGIIVMLRFSPPVISSSWFVPAYTVRADLVIRDPGRIGGD
jgi:hypothetical protein